MPVPVPFAYALVDHRLAFVALAALTVGAAVPLAFAWARVLPEEAPPFDGSAPSNALHGAQPQGGNHRAKYGFVAIALLVLVTLSYAIQFPDVPRHLGLQWLESLAPEIEPAWIAWGGESVFALINLGAASYAVFSRKNPLRVPLGLGAAFVLVLWILGHSLRQSLLATP